MRSTTRIRLGQPCLFGVLVVLAGCGRAAMGTTSVDAEWCPDGSQSSEIGQPVEPDYAPNTHPWPMVHHDSGRTSRAAVKGPRAGKLRWKQELPGFPATVPLVRHDGSAVLLISDQTAIVTGMSILSMEADGHVSWKVTVAPTSEIVLLGDGSVLCCGAGGISRLTRTGQHAGTFWPYPGTHTLVPIVAPAASGVWLLTTDSDAASPRARGADPAFLRFVDWTGQEHWQRTWPDMPADVALVGDVGAIVAAPASTWIKKALGARVGGPSKLEFLAPDGTPKWTVATEGYRVVLADAEHAAIFDVGWLDKSDVARRDLAGQAYWKVPVSGVRGAGLLPAGGVVLQMAGWNGAEDEIRALDASGALSWSKTGLSLTQGLAIDVEGWVYHGVGDSLSPQHGVAAVRPDGTAAWTVSASDWPGQTLAIAMGPTGSLYFYSFDKTPPTGSIRSWLGLVADE